MDSGNQRQSCAVHIATTILSLLQTFSLQYFFNAGMSIPQKRETDKVYCLCFKFQRDMI